MQATELNKHLAGLNRVHLTVQLEAENTRESEAISKVSTGKANDGQKKMIEDAINNYCKRIADHFILISAKVGNGGKTDIVLEQFGVGA